ncbi:AfsA-related hotdog domain-containing protein [Streptomyces sp. NPDC046465]|uniref:AfsA-related hotdog domain-containing protein n=1 Tax=Streptomyces sp. NPDC046465 TaxID=3155810 RepID=UPI0033DEA506
MTTTDPVASLRFGPWVSPTTVNRTSAREVFVTDHARVGEEEFAIAARVAHDHPLWSDRRGHGHDPAVVVEAFRQAFVVVRHEYLGVPRGTPTAVQQLTLDVHDLSAFRTEGTTPLQGVIKVRVVRTGETLDIAGDFFIGPARAMTLSFKGILFSRDSYRGIREYQRSRRAVGTGGGPAGRPIEPELVGRRDRRNVVIGPAARRNRFPLVVDRSHASFFDRDYDHVPGSLLIEAMRQSALRGAAEAGLCTGDASLIRAELDFGIFVETDTPATCGVSVAGRPGAVTATVGIDQADVRAASGVLELTEGAS